MITAASTLDTFIRDMGAYPPQFTGNPLHLLRFDDAHQVVSARGFLQACSGPALQREERSYIVPQVLDGEEWPFPLHTVDGRPDPKMLSDLLFARFDMAREVLFTQRDIAPHLCERAVRQDADVVALFVCDGLGYYDLPDALVERENIAPCLVDGVSITQWGYRQVVGKPSLSQRLFAHRYTQQLGLTYFDARTNELAADLFASFGGMQVERIKSFDEGMALLKERCPARGFVQWAIAGLDGLSHHHRDAPPREAYLRDILERFDKLCEELGRGGRRVLACLTADHGLLWREHLSAWEGETGRPFVVTPLLPEDARHPRYVKGTLARSFARPIESEGQRYSLLRAPILARALRVDEWGVHGGISAWESLVPMWVREIAP